MNIPDPAWYYAYIWEKCQSAKSQIELAISCMSSAEDAEAAINETIKEALKEAQNEISNALRKIDNFDN